MKCFAGDCEGTPKYKLRGFDMCTEHYIEALEHGAHLDFGQWDGKDNLFFNLAGSANDGEDSQPTKN
jgi:hypothetical protein